jgi:hypothetical protein
MSFNTRDRLGPSGLWTTALLLAVMALCLPPTAQANHLGGAVCNRNLKADVVALDQVFFWNRLGAVEPQGMIYALRRDVVPIDPNLGLTPGNVMLREDKRPRPLILRMGVGDCLRIEFQNLLNPVPVDADQPATREASIHVIGLQLVNSIDDDGSFVGLNSSSQVPPGGTAVYTLYAEREGQHVFNSTGALTGGDGNGGSTAVGLFGAVMVEPEDARFYRSQVTRNDMDLGTRRDAAGNLMLSADGHPLIDYNAKYPPGHPQAGTPIFSILDDFNNIVHSDLTAIIVGSNPNGGPGAGAFPAGTYPPNPVYPHRDEPFREFALIYHDEPGAVQAFPIFNDPVFKHTTHSIRDAFAINYGTGGIGAEILANRLGVGPMHDCTGCKYEEFFLTSWAVGDPAMVVDVPANAPCTVADVQSGDVNACTPQPGPKATKAFYPDDPSNVYHSYIRDHVKFRILHGGVKEHHIHHLHAHQWVFTPDSDESTYLDSQALGPSASFTLEMTYNSSGNRNATVGDAIFHCHFYPHFAQGMWSLWRNHDVFERGTLLDADGRPAPAARAYPDGEIAAGTPIVGLVPMPGKPMAPMPQADVSIVDGQVFVTGTGNPGFPFFVPGIAGHRPPHPPLDVVVDDAGVVHDGGLQRHVLAGGETIHVETRLDFTKELENIDAIPIPEDGAPVEQAAMLYHEQRFHDTFFPDGTPATGNAGFVANGLPRQPGAPFAEPCMLENRATREAVLRTESPRRYKAADIQLDVVLNKGGWHFPQQRIITLWDDVQPTFDGDRPPEPFFFRANSEDCITYWLTNLVPNVYELDDFQVRTPTDILGQHIHLVKFDVTSSDGAANGWNYEDGTFSPDEVRERMRAIRAHNGCIGDEITGGDPRDGTFECPIALPHPFFGAGPDADGDGVPDWLGGMTTVQRWYADDVLNLQGKDRTLRTVFTHDHFGPSTHQQAGLYAGLVVEPKDSVWRNPESGQIFGGRHDGGPTSWRADILTADVDESYREFMFEFQDYQLAYEMGSHPELPFGKGPTAPKPWNGVARLPGEGFDRPAFAINPPGRIEVGLPFLVADPQVCPGGVPLPCPEGVSAADVGTMSVNYRNEPLALRVRDPATNTQAPGDAGDLALAFSSRITRADPRLNIQPAFYPPLTSDIGDKDPYTPLLRAFEHDKVQIRILVGAHEEGHNFSVNGLKWLFEPSEPNSGYRNSQMMGISEHFEFEVPQVVKPPVGPSADYLWSAGSSTDDLWNGIWGLLRVYRNDGPNLLKLPNNPQGGRSILASELDRFRGVCPKNAPRRVGTIVATTAQQLLPGGKLVYNSRPGKNGEGPLNDPTGMLFIRKSDIDPFTGRIKNGVPVEPFVGRANAGDCIEITVENHLPNHPLDLDGFATLPNIVDNFNNNQIRPSNRVGMHQQLYFYDVSRGDGMDVGRNQIQTIPPGRKKDYQWYVGDVFVRADGTVRVTPIEFGVTNIMSPDRIKQPAKGLFGASVAEPRGSTYDRDNAVSCSFCNPPEKQTSATVFKADGTSFREFVLFFQNFVNLRFGDGTAIPNIAQNEDPEDSGHKAFNYRTEPMWFRFGYPPETPLTTIRARTDLYKAVSNSLIGGDPETPIFRAHRGDDVRFRVVHPGGNQRNNVFAVHGHIWEQEPYIHGSTQIGDNPRSLWEGSRMGVGPSTHFDAVIESAGGAFRVPGDYLYRDQASFQFDAGLWGILWVTP